MNSFENENGDLMNINFKTHFNRFGGARKFAESVGVEFEDLKLWVSNSYIPAAWRSAVRKAVASDIIKKVHNDMRKEQDN